MNNYYVRRTGDNSDYLEHALLGFSASGGTVHNRSGSHKYIAKFNVGGRTRYIYDPKELAAYQAAKSGISRVARAGSNFARNKIGIGLKREMNIAKYRADEESKSASKFVGSGRTRGSNGDVRQKGADSWYSDNARENVRNDARKAVKNYRDIQGEYNRSLIGRAENLGNKARKMAGDLSSNARNAGKSFAGSISKEAYKVGKKVANKSGYTAMKQRNKDLKRADATMQAYNRGLGKDPDYISRARKGANSRAYSQYRKSQDAYSKTPLGKAESIRDRVVEPIEEKINDIRYSDRAKRLRRNIRIAKKRRQG